MDIHIRSIDTLKDGEIRPKSKGKTFRVEGAQPEYVCTDGWLQITGQSFEEYYNQKFPLYATAPDREITRTATILMRKSEILSLLQCAFKSNLIDKKDITEIAKANKS